MTKEQLLHKLCSRKLWVAIISFGSMLAIYLGADENSVTEVTSILGAFGTMVGYMLAEGIADSGRKGDTDDGEEC